MSLAGYSPWGHIELDMTSGLNSNNTEIFGTSWAGGGGESRKLGSGLGERCGVRDGTVWKARDRWESPALGEASKNAQLHTWVGLEVADDLGQEPFIRKESKARQMKADTWVGFKIKVLSSVPCDDLERWNRRMGEEAQEGGDTCIHMADSWCCTAETNTTL